MFPANECVFTIAPDASHRASGKPHKGTGAARVCGFTLNGTKDFSNAQHDCCRVRKTPLTLAGHLISNLSANLAQPLKAVKVVDFGTCAATHATSRHQRPGALEGTAVCLTRHDRIAP